MEFLDDATIAAHCPPAALVDALAAAFRTAGPIPERMHCDLPGDDGAKLLVMPAWSGRRAIGVKTVTAMPGNAALGLPTINGLYTLLDGRTGAPLAVLSARALTNLRTAAVSALAARHLARADARTLLMVGTGVLAPFLIAAHRAVRSYERVLVWGRSREKAERLARSLDLPEGRASAVDSLPEAVREADVVSCATLSPDPLVKGVDVRAGSHVDLVGSFTPHMREADPALFAAGRLVVDTRNAFAESGDLIAPLSAGLLSRDGPTLQQLLNDPSLERRSDEEITVFKSVGTGLADIAAADFIFGRYRAAQPSDAEKPAAP